MKGKEQFRPQNQMILNFPNQENQEGAGTKCNPPTAWDAFERLRLVGLM